MLEGRMGQDVSDVLSREGSWCGAPLALHWCCTVLQFGLEAWSNFHVCSLDNENGSLCKELSYRQAAVIAPLKRGKVKLLAQSLSQCTVIKPKIAQDVIIASNCAETEFTKKRLFPPKIWMHKLIFFFKANLSLHSSLLSALLCYDWGCMKLKISMQKSMSCLCTA